MSDRDGFDDVFDPDELALADALDDQIEALQSGRPVADVPAGVLLLHVALRTDPPAALATRVEADIEREMARSWRPFRWVAALLAYLFISHGLGNLVVGDWVADGIGESFSAHANREASFAMIAAGLAVGAGALYRRFTSVSAVAGVPLGVGLGLGGISEIGVFAPGAALHLSQGVVAIALAVIFWRYRRDTSGDSDEEGPWT
jgi:hypothetical protein